MPSLRKTLSAVRAGLMTTTGLQRRGFFIPYPYAASRDRNLKRYAALSSCFEAQAARIEDFLGEIEARIDDFRSFGSAPLDPKWAGTMFPPRDGAAAYTAVARTRPRRIIEIGSGNSTHFMMRAIRDHAIDCEVTCIDPAPRIDISSLGVRHVPRMLQITDGDMIGQLENGDVLFIDSSHIMLPGMDVDIEFNCFFPILKSGVVVHVHDVFLPYAYPKSWDNREWSEQCALGGWIYSGFFEILYAGHYASVNMEASWARISAALPPLANHSAGSIWLRRAN